MSTAEQPPVPTPTYTEKSKHLRRRRELMLKRVLNKKRIAALYPDIPEEEVKTLVRELKRKYEEVEFFEFSENLIDKVFKDAQAEALRLKAEMEVAENVLPSNVVLLPDLSAVSISDEFVMNSIKKELKENRVLLSVGLMLGGAFVCLLLTFISDERYRVGFATYFILLTCAGGGSLPALMGLRAVYSATRDSVMTEKARTYRMSTVELPLSDNALEEPQEETSSSSPESQSSDQE